MAIELEEAATGSRSPVLRRQKLGERFVGALVRKDQRDVQKDGAPVLKENGKPRQELVVTMVCISSTMSAGLGDEVDVPKPGDVVRTILRGGGFGAWIDADKALKPRFVGDVITLTSDFGQAYDANGRPSGGQLTTQAECDAVPRAHALGIYGAISIRRPETVETEWVNAAEAAYHGLRKGIEVDQAAVDDIFGD